MSCCGSRCRDRSHYDVMSESGVPLRSLARAEALRRARGVGPSERLWEALEEEVNAPNALTPGLLEEAGRLVAGDAQLSEAVKAMKILLADHQTQAELAEAVKRSGKLNGITTTNLWVDAVGQRWFCILSPGESRNGTSISNHPGFGRSRRIPLPCVFLNRWWRRDLRMRSRRQKFRCRIISAFRWWLKASRLLCLRLGGRVEWQGCVGEMLAAEEHFQMSEPSMRPERANFNDPHHQEIKVEGMPGHPQFLMQIRLTDREGLYANQRRLQLVFGTLMRGGGAGGLGWFCGGAARFFTGSSIERDEIETSFLQRVA